MAMMRNILVAVWSLIGASVAAFAPLPVRKPALTQHAALWRHFVERTDEDGASSSNGSNPFGISVALAGLVCMPMVCGAVSGGGLDYANIDITGQDFSKGNYKGKDFTQVIAKNTQFMGSNLQGCRFYKAYLVSVRFALVGRRCPETH